MIYNFKERAFELECFNLATCKGQTIQIRGLAEQYKTVRNILAVYPHLCDALYQRGYRVIDKPESKFRKIASSPLVDIPIVAPARPLLFDATKYALLDEIFWNVHALIPLEVQRPTSQTDGQLN